MKSLLFCFLFLLIGCGEGPKITDCVSNPRKNNFICSNANNSKKALTFTPDKVDNWIFVSSADLHSMLMACQNHLGGVKVKVCIFAAATLNFSCFDEVTGQSSGMSFAHSENWIGTSAIDLQLLLNFCESLK